MSPVLTLSRLAVPVGVLDVYRGGSGPPMLYLHSLLGEGGDLPFLQGLAATNTVIAPLLPGYAASGGLEQLDTVEDVVLDVLVPLLDVLAIDHCAVIGTCLGGWMAAELATRYPQRVDRLVLVNPLGLYLPGHEIPEIFGRPPAEFAALMAARPDTVAELHRYCEMQAFYDQGGLPPFELAEPHLKAMAATARLGYRPYLHNPKLRPRLDRITGPTIVVRGTDDRLLTEEHAATYAEEIPGARLEAMSGGHLLTLENPPQLLQTITEFALAATAPAGAEA